MHISFRGQGMYREGTAKTAEGEIHFSVRNSELTIQDEDKFSKEVILMLIDTLLDKYYIWLKYKGHRIGRRMNLRAVLFGESNVVEFPHEKQQAAMA